MRNSVQNLGRSTKISTTNTDRQVNPSSTSLNEQQSPFGFMVLNVHITFCYITWSCKNSLPTVRSCQSHGSSCPALLCTDNAAGGWVQRDSRAQSSTHGASTFNTEIQRTPPARLRTCGFSNVVNSPMHSGWKPLHVRLGRHVREMEPCSK